MRSIEEIEEEVESALSSPAAHHIGSLLKQGKKKSARNVLLREEGHWLDSEEAKAIIDHWAKQLKQDCEICGEKMMTSRGVRQSLGGSVMCCNCAKFLPDNVLRRREDMLQCPSCKSFKTKRIELKTAVYCFCKTCDWRWEHELEQAS